MRTRFAICVVAVCLIKETAMAQNYDDAINQYAMCLLPERIAIDLFQVCDQPDAKRLNAALMRLIVPGGINDLSCQDELSRAMDLSSSEEAREFVHGDAEKIVDELKSNFYALNGGLPTDVGAESSFFCKIRDQEVDNGSKIGEFYRILSQ